MITEFIITSPLLFLAYYQYISWKYILLVCCIYYWLPKWMFLNLFLDRYYPMILTRNKNMKDNKIALTFDDVPYGSHKEIIELLNKYNMKGTFFVISDYVNNNNETILVDAVKNDHQLGNHGKTNSMHAIKSPYSLKIELDSCHKLIEKIYELANKQLPSFMCYRPGCGLFHTKMINMVMDNKYSLALGSVYPNDPVVVSSTLNYYYLTTHIEKGDIVILHDRTWTVPMLDNLLKWMQNNNYTSVTINELMLNN